MIDAKDLSLDRPISMWKNLPLDKRMVTASLAEIDNYITYPYVGMIFYSEFEDDFYKVKSVTDGYKIIRSNTVSREVAAGSKKLEGYFIGEYEQLSLEGNKASSITEAYVENGYLILKLYDETVINAGYVQGDPGYSPTITESEENNDNLSLGDLIYKLIFKYQDESHEFQTVTTDNLIGPYIVDISDTLNDEGIDSGTLQVTLSTGQIYEFGPYGIYDMYLSGRNLVVKFNNGTQKIFENVVGTNGVRGEDGTSIIIVDRLATYKALSKITSAVQGECYIVEEDGCLYEWYNDSWKNLGRIVGEKGDDGESSVLSLSTDTSIYGQVTVTMYVNAVAQSSFTIKNGYNPTVEVVEGTDDEERETIYLRITYQDNEGTSHTIETDNLKGYDGTSVIIKGSLDSTEELSNVGAEIGDCYIIDGWLWEYNANENVGDIYVNGYERICYMMGNSLIATTQTIYSESNDKAVGTTVTIYSKPGDGSANEVIDTFTVYNGASAELSIIDGVLSVRYIYGDGTVTDWESLISIDSVTGSSVLFNEDGITTNTIEAGSEASVIITKSDYDSENFIQYYDIEFNIPRGEDGISISSSEIDENGDLNITYSNDSSENVGHVVGADGISITETSIDENGDLNITYSNSTSVIIGHVVGTDGTNGEDGISITSSEIDENGDLNITYSNESSENVGHVVGDSITIISSEYDDNGNTVITFSDGTSITVNKGDKGISGDSGEVGSSITITNVVTNDEGNIEVTFSDDTTITIPKGDQGEQGIQGETGENGEDGVGIESITATNSTESSAENTITITLSNGSTSTFSIYNGTKGEDGVSGENGIDGVDGKNIEIGTVTTNTVDSTIDASVSIELDTDTSNDTTNVYNFTFTIPKGDQGEQGIQGETGENGTDGIDGREIELTVTDTYIQWRYVTDDNSDEWKDLISIETITGENGTDGVDGKDASVSITENEENTDSVYKLDISYSNGDETVEFTTPNLKGGVNELYEILDSLPTTDDGTLDTNHIYLVLNENTEEVVSGESNYDKYIILSISEDDSTITWEKIESAEVADSILILCEELPSIETASSNYIYCLLTPEYQRGLNIGLTDDESANKNYYEEWIVIETEDGTKTWELLAPQVYRISASMIDYLWDINDTFTVYDDWDTASEISEYQRQNYGEATALSNFIFRLESSGSGYNIILVKESSNSDVTSLSIASTYTITLNGTTYTCTVTELDGTYDESYTYYEADSEGNVSIITYDSADDFGTESVFTGPNVYSVYIADSVTKITNGFLYTSNLAKYHIPYDLEIIGDYAFYNTKSPLVQFEQLTEDGTDVIIYPFEESKVKYIGIHAFDGNSNLTFAIRDDDGEIVESNIVKTPSTLKKICDYAFFSTRIATLNTTLSTSLFLGDHAFVQCVHGGQTLSSTTYYTDATFLGVDGLTHDTINYSSDGVSNWFNGEDYAGVNFNFISGYEDYVMSVTLDSVDTVITG